jgi:hypothetical protein
MITHLQDFINFLNENCSETSDLFKRWSNSELVISTFDKFLLSF